MSPLDVTSYTSVDDYLPHRVPEIWLYKGNQLKIYCWQGDRYVVQTNSRYFPSFDVSALVAQCLQVTYERNSSVAIRELRQQLTEN